MNKFKCLFSKIYYKAKFKNIKIKSGTYIGKNSIFDGFNTIGTNSVIAGEIGYASNIGDECNFTAKVGKFCSIGSHVYGLQFTHPSNTFVSTHPAFYSTLKQSGFTYVKEQKFDEFKMYDCEKKRTFMVGNDVWIGSNVVILGGITIGDGAIVAAGAVVVNDVAPYTIVGGVPAKELKKRFTEDQINILLNVKWWDKPNEWLCNHAEEFENVEKFVNHLELNCIENKDTFE